MMYEKPSLIMSIFMLFRIMNANKNFVMLAFKKIQFKNVIL